MSAPGLPPEVGREEPMLLATDEDGVTRWRLCQRPGPTLDNGPNAWIARPACILPWSHSGMHYSAGTSGGGWEVRWTSK